MVQGRTGVYVTSTVPIFYQKTFLRTFIDKNVKRKTKLFKIVGFFK